MKTNTLVTNQLSARTYEWYLRYLTQLDNKDIDGYGAFLADDVTLQMNDADPVSGKAQVLAGLRGYWQSFGRLEHDLLNIYGTDDSFVLEARNHYTRLDGQPVTLRAVAITERNAAGLVCSVRLYSDTRPLFAEAAD